MRLPRAAVVHLSRDGQEPQSERANSIEERIRAHVVLCWLALLLIRIIETTTDETWTTIRRELDRLHLGTFTGPTGLFRQVTTLTKPQTDLLAKLGIPTPKQIIALEPAPR
ncbi:hypothetical protein [Kitasatospora sp. NE20-6]|uniref:hypothetical protein n=1 Tax=Kitasatospora sp. NE20-6 TaxID=2859066 RepID=UPI0038B3A4B3